MALFNFFKKLSFFSGRSTEGLQEEDLDFQKWIAAHRNWRQRLVSYIDGSSREVLDEHAICHDDRCDLGKWVHSNGKKFYGDEAVFQRLVGDHAAFHRAAGDVVGLYKTKGEKDARRVLSSDFDLCSLRVIDGLEQLERRVKQ
ncbi:MAG: CZB domain-containing protein [Rhodocyclales bacterium]|nr:CZB domain-containing protein [Rhodocyclales bacterium]